MNDYDDEEFKMPNFECTLPIPDEITGSARMLLQQVNILQQKIDYVHKNLVFGKRALILARANELAIARVNKVYWMILGGVVVIEAALKFAGK